jgi:hypothetical protein
VIHLICIHFAAGFTLSSPSPAVSRIKTPSEPEKTFFEDSPWNPTFDAHYLNGGGAFVDIGLDLSTDDMSSAAIEF